MPPNRTLHPVPLDRMPRGFLERLDDPPAPVRPRPAATVVLLRPVDSEGRGLQVLLLRRSRAAGFVPGAWVFPGGRIDEADGSLARSLGGGPEEAPPPGEAAREAARVAALREAFEETGILLARRDGAARVLTTGGDQELEAARRALLRGETDFGALLRARGLVADIAAPRRIAHWITPEVEPRRYDTHFFAAAVPAGTPAHVDAGEITEHRWVEPARARADHEDGRLPMVLPTVRTLELLARFRSPEEVLEYHRGRPVAPILPRFVRTPDGVALEVVDDGEDGTP